MPHARERLLVAKLHINGVVDLALNQAAKPLFHQYLDPAWYHLWRIVSENVLGQQICKFGVTDLPQALPNAPNVMGSFTYNF